MDRDSSSAGHGPERQAAAHAIPPAPPRHCRTCGGTIGAADAYCAHCGRRQEQSKAWFYHPAWIVFLAFFILGPFALPLVWKSSRMGRGVKAVLAIVISVYSALCAYAIYKAGALEYRELKKLGDMMQQFGAI